MAGEPSARPCPVCDGTLTDVHFIYGDELGRSAGQARALRAQHARPVLPADLDEEFARLLRAGQDRVDQGLGVAAFARAADDGQYLWGVCFFGHRYLRT